MSFIFFSLCCVGFSVHFWCVCLCLKLVCLRKVAAVLRQELCSVHPTPPAPHRKCICFHSPNPAMSRARRIITEHLLLQRPGSCRQGKIKRLISKSLSTKVPLNNSEGGVAILLFSTLPVICAQRRLHQFLKQIIFENV